MKDISPDKWLTADEVAALVGMHVRSVRRHIAEGRLPSTRWAGVRSARVRERDVVGFYGGKEEDRTGEERILAPAKPPETATISGASPFVERTTDARARDPEKDGLLLALAVSERARVRAERQVDQLFRILRELICD